MQDIESMGMFGERRLRAQNQQALKCPRCDSLNTKFCYYNNYNLSQPRHFCKSCRRYWTRGGVLRNVPVGGGCRKAKRSSKPKHTKSSTAAASAPPSSSTDHVAPPQPDQPSDCGIFSETASFITSSSDPLLYGLDDISHHKIGGGLLDHTVQADFPDGGFGPLDWPTTGGANGPDQPALFDLPWAHTQWIDQDRSHLYLP